MTHSETCMGLQTCAECVKAMSELTKNQLRLPSGRILTFDEATHRYTTDDGERFDGLHAKMRKKQVGFPPKDEESIYMQRGNRWHKLLHYYNEGDLDESSIDDADRLILQSWVQGTAMHGLKVQAAEILVADEKRRLATKIDVVGPCELSGGDIAVHNIKTGQYWESYDVQLELEAMLYEATFGVRPKKLLWFVSKEGIAARPLLMNRESVKGAALWVLDES